MVWLTSTLHQLSMVIWKRCARNLSADPPTKSYLEIFRQMSSLILVEKPAYQISVCPTSASQLVNIRHSTSVRDQSGGWHLSCYRMAAWIPPFWPIYMHFQWSAMKYLVLFRWYISSGLNATFDTQMFTGNLPFYNITSEVDVIIAIHNHEYLHRPHLNHPSTSQELDDNLWELIEKCQSPLAIQRPTALALCQLLASMPTCSNLSATNASDENGKVEMAERAQMSFGNIDLRGDCFEEAHNSSHGRGLGLSSHL